MQLHLELPQNLFQGKVIFFNRRKIYSLIPSVSLDCFSEKMKGLPFYRLSDMLIYSGKRSERVFQKSAKALVFKFE